MKYLIITVAFLFSVTVNAAKVPTQTVEGTNVESGMQVVEAITKQFNYNKISYDLEKKIINTDWIKWSSLAFKNRAKLKFEIKENSIVITMVNREYLSENKWQENITNLSKKKNNEYIGSFADKITEIYDDEKLLKDAFYNSVIIRAFKPVIKALEKPFSYKFIKGVKDKELTDKNGKKLPIPNYFIEVEITNTSNSEEKLYFGGGRIQKRNDKTGNYGWVDDNYRIFFPENEFEIGGECINKSFKAGETIKAFLSIYNMETELEDDIIPLFMFDIHDKGTWNNNIPIPFDANIFK